MPSDALFQTPLAGGFRIGAWTVLPRSNELSRPGETVHVEPKPMQVLTLLAERAGEPVTRDELLDRVWADVFVTENALSRCISQLRKLFDDDPREPRVIETIPTVGYRLIAPVHHLGDGHDGALSPAEAADVALSVPGVATVEEDEPPASVPAEALRDVRFGARMTLAWVALAVALAALGLIAWLGGEAEPERTTRPLTSEPGRETSPALSPDGSRVLYVHTTEDAGSDLFVRVLDGTAPLQLTSGPARDMSPAWAPDGQSVAFVRCDDGGCGLFEVSALGGPARRLADGAALPWGLAFEPGGEALAFVARDSAAAPTRIYRVDLAAGERRPLTDPPPTSGGDLYPVFAPDGSALLFRRRTGGGGDDLYRLAGDGPPERLTHDGRALAGAAFTRDGRDVVFSSNRTGMYELWRMPATGGAPERVEGLVARDPGGPEVGEGRLVFEEWAFEINLWGADTDSAAQPLVVSTWWDKHPHLSPNGARLAFISNRFGPPEVWTAAADGSAPTRLTDFGGASVEAPRWSPDGERIVFQARPEVTANLYAIDAEGGPPRLLTDETADDVAPRWSRDGRWIYFGSNRDDTWQLWKMPAGGGVAARVTDEGGYTGEESADGTEVLYAKFNTAGLWARPVAGGSERLVTDRLPAAFGQSWAVTDEGPVILSFDDATLRVARLGADGAVTPLPLDLGQIMPGEPGLTATVDGQRIVFAQVDRVESDLMLVEPFE